MQSAPKFMMPNNTHFLMRHAHQTEDSELMDYVQNTLTKISYGGVYDHIGGGFSRYSVDDKWHVPHFEKMLYDNAQLVSLYSDAYLLTKNDWYKTVVEETLEFIDRELTRDNGSFYSSLDADSDTKEGELEEGAYYVWTEDELQELLEDDFDLFKSYYNINSYGKWEDDNYVLIRNKSNAEIAKEFSISEEALSEKLNNWRQELLNARKKRAMPRLDDKSLTAWNALMLEGYLDAYRVFGKDAYLKTALKNAKFIKTEMLGDDGKLLHTYNKDTAKINGYLEDYASVIKAFIKLYEVTLNEDWLDLSKKLADYTFEHFYNPENKMFYFTSDLDDKLVTRQIEYQDNVIPASNSIMAKNLFLLSHHFEDERYRAVSEQQLKNVLPEAQKYAGGYSNWMDLMLNYTKPFYELVVVGENASERIHQLQDSYIPNKLIAGSTEDSNRPLLENRYVKDQTVIYVCVEKTCKLPTESVEKAKSLME